MCALPRAIGWQRFHKRAMVVSVGAALTVALFAGPSNTAGALVSGTHQAVGQTPVTFAQSVRTTKTTKRKPKQKSKATATRPAIQPSVGPTSPPTASSSTTSSTPSTTTAARASTVVLPTPTKYLDDALTFIERYWVRRRSVDVRAITDRARSVGASAQSIPDLYPVLRQTVRELGDGHSAFLDPAAARSLLSGTSTGFGLKVYPPDVIFVVPGSPAELAGIRTFDRIVSFNGKPFSATTPAERTVETAVIRVSRPVVGDLEFTVRRGELTTAELPSARPIDARLGYLELPGSTGTPDNERAFADVGARAVAAVEQQVSPCGWVLDLRRNSGGFPFSMMSVLEPFLPDQTVGGFVYGDDKREVLRFASGKVLVDSRVMWSSAAPVRLRDPNVPVAVLTSSLTGSAGEIATIAFIGRPASRSFGAPTVGVTSANVGIRLPDDSFLMVTHSYDLDRNGNVYDGPVAPNEVAPIDWSVFGTAQDPTVAAATTWLGAQPACTNRESAR